VNEKRHQPKQRTKGGGGVGGSKVGEKGEGRGLAEESIEGKEGLVNTKKTEGFCEVGESRQGHTPKAGEEEGRKKPIKVKMTSKGGRLRI